MSALDFSLDLSLGSGFRSPAECVIKINEQEITNLYPYLTSATVRMSRIAAAECTMTFESNRDEHGTWAVQDSESIGPWKKILVEAVFGTQREEVMRGYIRDVQADYPDDMGSTTVTVKAQDESILLDREQVHKTWSTEEEPLSDGNIARQIASEHTLEPDVEDGILNASLNQSETAIRFLRKRAEANGFELFIRGGKLTFKSPELDGTAMPTILVYAGKSTNCNRIAIEHDGHKPDQISLSRASDTDPETTEESYASDLRLLGPVEATSNGMGLNPFVWPLPRAQGATEAEAQMRAQAKANENAWKIAATGELDGSLYGHVLLNHKTVTVDGIGEKYSGLYYVDEVTHKFTVDGYLQEFRLLRNATGEEGLDQAKNRLGGLV